MAIPTYKDCMLPFLEQLKDGNERPIRDAVIGNDDQITIGQVVLQLKVTDV